MRHTHDIEFTDDVVRKTLVSWSQGEPEREWAALVHLDEHAPDLGPRPIARFLVDDRPAVTMSRVSGLPLTGRVTRRQTEALATAVQRLFAVPIPTDLSVRANDPVRFHRRIQQAFSEEYEWSQCQNSTLVRHATDIAQNWLDNHQPPSDWLVDSVIALGDGNLDNVLRDGQVCRLIDWEEYGASGRAYEVSDLLEHASTRLERRLDVQALLGQLTLDGVQRARVEHHRRMFACFWLAMLLPGNAGWRRNPPGSTEDQARHLIELVGQ